MRKLVALRWLVLLLVLLTAGTAAAADTAPPTIDSGPSGNSVEIWPVFTFSVGSGSGFDCSLDGAPFAPCRSPDLVGPLKLGAHTFAVRSTASDGGPGSDPAVRTWNVVGSPSATPVVKLFSPRRLRLAPSGFRLVSGSAASASGVTRIEIALQRGGPDRDYFPPRCTYFDLRRGGIVYQPCLLPAYTPVRGTEAWRYVVPRRVRSSLKTGRWTLIVRAFNSFDVAGRTKFPLTFGAKHAQKSQQSTRRRLT